MFETFGNLEVNFSFNINKCCWIQKQPPRGVPRKMCSEDMQQIYRRTSMPKWLKSHFGMGVLLQICCMSSEHLFSGLLWGTASVNSYQFFRSYATFFLKALISYKNELQRAVTIPSHWRNYVVFIYSCINFYCPTLRGAWVMWALLFHVTKKWNYCLTHKN